ncbi:hypothetical protein BFL35_04925 [Clavibacter michiganensis]|nr:hypothetical protein BFL35_04925 [Clavibacter michiganensis]
MGGCAEDVRDRALLHDAAVVHHGDAVGEARDDREVVADEQRGLAARAQVGEEVDDAGLHGRVERGRGLVGDEERRIQRERRREERALAEPAGQLARALADADRRIRHPDALEQLEDARLPGPRVAHPVQAEGGADLAADRTQGVERRQRVLEDEPDAGSADAAPLARARGAQVAAGHLQDVGAHAGTGSGEAQQAPRGDALAGPGRPDERQALARRDPQGDAVHDADAAEGDAEVLHAEGEGRGRRVGHAGCGSAAHDARTRRSSARPSTVEAVAVSTIMRPGTTVSHGAEPM